MRRPGVRRAASDRWTAVIPELRKFWDGLFQIHVAKSYWEFPGPGKRAARSAFMIGLPLAPQITVMRFENNVDWSRTRLNFKIFSYDRVDRGAIPLRDFSPPACKSHNNGSSVQKMENHN